MKKILKDYLISYSIGFDNFMDSETFGKFSDCIKTDIVKLNASNH